MFITFYRITTAFLAPARHLDPIATVAVKHYSHSETDAVCTNRDNTKFTPQGATLKLYTPSHKPSGKAKKSSLFPQCSCTLCNIKVQGSPRMKSDAHVIVSN